MSFPGFAAGLVLSALATISGLIGFGVVSDDAPLAAKVFSAFFLFSAAGAFWWSRLTRKPSDTPPAR